jgi:hypothetical protein
MRVTLPPGTYVIADPCYHVPDEQWDRVLDESDIFARPEATFEAEDGSIVKVVAFGTAYGDGVYEDQYGNHYPVDAGLIGIMSTEHVVPTLHLGAVHSFDYPVECFEEDGTIYFGHIRIPTGESYDEIDFV